MTIEFDAENWTGDGLPEDEDEAVELLRALGPLPFEFDAMVNACKREAWVREHVARHENREWHLTVTRYLWRRVERLRGLRERVLADDDPTDAA